MKYFKFNNITNRFNKSPATCLLPAFFILVMSNLGHGQCSNSELQIEISYSAFGTSIKGDAIKIVNTENQAEVYCIEFGQNFFIDTICVKEATDYKIFGYDNVGEPWGEPSLLVKYLNDPMDCGPNMDSTLIFYSGNLIGLGPVQCNANINIDQLVAEFTTPKASCGNSMPICLTDTIKLTSTGDYASVNFLDYIKDDGSLNFDFGWDQNDMPITQIDSFDCGGPYSVLIGATDNDGNSISCQFQVIVDCPPETCNNKYLYFDGINDRINIPNQHTGNVEFTIECWFKSENKSIPINGSGFNRIFTLGTFNRFEIGVAGNSIRLHRFSNTALSFPATLQDGNWHHLALTRNDSLISIYFDGIPLIQSLVSGNIDLSNIRVGYFDNNNFNLNSITLWKGGIDEIKLWNRPLSISEINDSKGKINTLKKDCGLIGYWRMEDGIADGDNQSINTIIDSVGNNDGTLVGIDLTGDISNFVCNDSIDLNYDPSGCCQVAIFNSTQCNIINLNSAPLGFADGNKLTYKWSSPNTSFKSSAKDTIFNYLGDLPAVIVCLEVTDGNCIAQTCDTIVVTLPKPPVFQSCPGSISLSTVDSCSLKLPLNIPRAIDPCTGLDAIVGCVRSDGLPLTAAFPLGKTIMTCTALSGLGNQYNATCRYEIEILDETKPICKTKNAEVFLDTSGFATFSPGLINNGSSDKCGEVSLSVLGQQTFNCSQLGNQIKTLIVTDLSGNTSTCSATITVRDTIAPICKAKTLNKEINSNGNASIVAIDLNDNSIDNCGNLSFSASKTMFNCADLKNVNIVTLTVIDQSGNTSSCPVEVKLTDPNNYCACLNDLIPPICKTRNITISLDATGKAQLTPDMINEGSFDACSEVTLQIEGIQSFDCSNLGKQTVNLLVTDIAKNVSFCSADVVVEDKIKPTCTLASKTYYLDQTGSVALNKENLNIILSDNCNSATIISNPLTYSCNNIGSRFISIAVADESGNTNSCAATITIRDTIKPVCSIPPKAFYLGNNGVVVVTQASLMPVLSDNCSFVNTNFNNQNYTCNDLGTRNVSFVISDASGNSNTCATIITIRDTIKPACNVSPTTFYLDEDGIASVSKDKLAINVNDNCPNPMTMFETKNYTCTDLGTKMITVNVVDLQGNMGSCSTNITIRDTIAPVCRVGNANLTIADNGLVSINASQLNMASSDNCGSITFSADRTIFTCADTNKDIPVTLTVTDQAGNSSSCTAIVKVSDPGGFCDCLVDTTPPVCRSKNIEVFLGASGQTSINANNINNGSTDACSAVTLLLEGQSIFTCTDVGIKNVSLVVTDQSNNMSVCQSVITVRDTISPVCNSKNVSLNLNANGTATLNPAELNLASSDNCNNLTFSTSKTMFNCADANKDITVILTVSDQSGNSSSCTSIVKVSDPGGFCNCFADTIPPLCRSKNIEVFLSSSGQVSIIAADIDNGSADACSTISLLLEGQTSFSCLDIGVSNVSLIVTDQANNTSICESLITIRDDQRPVCQAISLDLLSSDENGAFVSFDVFASDDCTPDEELIIEFSSPNNQVYACGSYNIVMTVTDGSGNRSTCDFVVNVSGCGSCCVSEGDFITASSQEFTLDAEFQRGTCVFTYTAPVLNDCQYLTGIDWGDGTTSNFMISSGNSITHIYVSAGVYEICASYSEFNGSNVCFENEVCSSIELFQDCTFERSSFSNKPAIKAHPNPTNGLIEINLERSGKEIFEIVVFNIQGNKLNVDATKVDSNHYQLDLDNLSSGIYIIRVQLSDGLFLTQKVIKI